MADVGTVFSSGIGRTASNELRVIGPRGTLNGNPLIDGGYAVHVCEADAGAVTGAPSQRQVDISANYRMRVAIDTLLFNDQFNGGALNTAIWKLNQTTFTAAYTGGQAILNNGSVTTASATSILNTYRGFPAYGSYPLQFEAEAIYYCPQGYQAHTVVEIGWGFATGIAAPTDGAFFRYTATGTLVGVLNYGGTETLTATMPLPAINTRHHYLIVIGNDMVEYWIDNTLYAYLSVPATQGMAIKNQNTPVLLRIYNDATGPSFAVQLQIANVSLSMGDMNTTKAWPVLQAGMGGNAVQGQTGQTMGSTAGIALNTLPTHAGLSGTTAALGSGLGGNFIADISGLAITTDYIVSSYQVPVDSATAPSKTFYITSLLVDALNLGAANAAFPLTWQMMLASGHTAVSLGTTEGNTSKAPRFMHIGCQTIPASAAIGVQATPTQTVYLDAPIVVQPGEFVQTVIRFLNYTTTASQQLHFCIGIYGYWE